jgi:hypothetical protein
MSSAAARMRLMRERKRTGIVPLTIEAQLDRLALALAEDGFLRDWDAEDRAAIEAALQTMVDAWIAHMIGPAQYSTPGRPRSPE